jgi:lysophospholipase L1-like esterase
MTLSFNANTRFAIIGDSLAVHMADNYFTQAQAFFGAGFTGTYLNAGIPGQGIADVLARIQTDIINVVPQPNLVFMLVGRNDVNGDGPTFSANYTATLNLLKAGGIQNVLCIQGAWLYTEAFPDPDTSFAALNARIVACASAAGLPTCDIRGPVAPWELVNNPGQAVSGKLTLDGTHPNAAGIVWVTPYLQASAPYSPPKTNNLRLVF